MELNKANQILNSIRASMRIDGYIVPPELQTKGMLILCGAETVEDNIKKALRLPNKIAAVIFFRLIQLKQSSPITVFDTDSICFLHKLIFESLRKDCGSLRKLNLSKNGSSFVDYKMLPSSLRSILKRINDFERNFKTQKNEFAAILAHFFRELLIMNPFAYGNGLVLRIFLEMFCEVNGFILDYYKCGCKEFTEACNNVIASDNVQRLYACLLKSLFYMRPQQLVRISGGENSAPSLLNHGKRSSRIAAMNRTAPRPKAETPRERIVDAVDIEIIPDVIPLPPVKIQEEPVNTEYSISEEKTVSDDHFISEEKAVNDEHSVSADKFISKEQSVIEEKIVQQPLPIANASVPRSISRPESNRETVSPRVSISVRQSIIQRQSERTGLRPSERVQPAITTQRTSERVLPAATAMPIRRTTDKVPQTASAIPRTIDRSPASSHTVHSQTTATAPRTIDRPPASSHTANGQTAATTIPRTTDRVPPFTPRIIALRRNREENQVTPKE